MEWRDAYPVPRFRYPWPGNVPSKMLIFQYYFLIRPIKFFEFFDIFKIRLPESEEKLKNAGRWVLVSESIAPVKLRGDAHGEDADKRDGLNFPLRW